ncbi:MAG: helicase [Clostridiaceae bacterium]|jgi:hypothetical protein|nr:helicase [Clostridiaceae bacterium]
MEEDKLKQALKGLKDFQLATVDRIYEVLSDKDINQKRFLVADEVGLGKTLIAKGIISKFVEEYLKEEKKKLKVVYLCSSLSIANQNLSKLTIFNNDYIENIYDSRLTMLPVNKDESNSFINFIPLTPATSFSITNGGGQMNERIVILAMLFKVPRIKNYKQELSYLLRQGVGEEKWNYHITNQAGYLNVIKAKLDKNIVHRFVDELVKDEVLFNELLDDCKRTRRGEALNTNLNRLIGTLRKLVVEVSVGELNPDIVIMDEFQRFRDLINPNNNSDMKVIANKFFSNKEQKIILLSATPYKLYSTAEELNNNEDHFKEFKEIIKFLINDEEKYMQFEEYWDEYSKTISSLSVIDWNEAITVKDKVEKSLRNVMCRTERIVVSNTGNGLIDTSKVGAVEIDLDDIRTFVQCDNVNKVLETLDKNTYSPMEFFKSSPFIYSFMENYKLKTILEDNIDSSLELQKVLKENPRLWINKDDISNYRQLKYGNSKFNKVKKEVFEKKGENLLWIPPSLPYYALMGPFKDSKGFSKTLIFSAWEMVPRMMSTLLSYECERATIGKLVEKSLTEDGEKEAKKSYFGEVNKRFPSRRLNFRTIESNKKSSSLRPPTMSNMILLYPCQYLCDMLDIKEVLRDSLTYENIVKKLKKQLKPQIRKLVKFKSANNKNIDFGWYWAAPILLDKLENENLVDEGIDALSNNNNLLSNESSKALREHFNYISTGFNNPKEFQLGQIPEDLGDVLVQIALGSPAVLACRSLLSTLKSDELVYIGSLCDKSFEIGEEFRLKFSQPEAISILDINYKDKEEYWRKVLRYCIDGNLQSVLDEYTYLINENSGFKDLEANKRVDNIGEKLRDTMSLRASSFKIDTYDNFISHGKDPMSMRTHYSVSFSQKNKDEKSQGRIDDVREAFNSPFRPFVLTTTSIGQEGLDFHWYCRKIVHWNLPSNPVDLEQREGRINRYKALVIRQNIAARYGNTKFSKDENYKIWDKMFQKAALEYRKEKDKEHSELVPYWILDDDISSIKIERIIPFYPYSKDSEHLDRLLKILSVYRVSMGQPRQEELVNYLLNNFDDDKIKELDKLILNLSPFYFS